MLQLPLKNSNRTMNLLTKTCLKPVPALYAQDGKGQAAIAYLKLFIDSFTWYITEIDPQTGEAFGLTVSSHCPEGELGYISVPELAQAQGSIGHGVERDRYFKPKPLSECPRLTV